MNYTLTVNSVTVFLCDFNISVTAVVKSMRVYLASSLLLPKVRPNLRNFIVVVRFEANFW